MKPGSLVVAYLHPGEVAHSFHRSMRGLWQHDATHNQRLCGFIEQECGAGRITEGRNDAVAKFLRTEGEWLAFVDSDMGFDPDALDRLIDAAYDRPDMDHPDEPGLRLTRPIVGALAFGQRKVALGPAGSTRVQQFPTIFQWAQGPTQAGTVPIYNYPPNTLVECDATGGAFFIVHRTVLEHLGAEYARPRQWFDEMRIGEQVFGEDLTFFHRCRQLGYPVHVHTGVRTSHRKPVYLLEETQPRQEAIPNIVVIPMKDRVDLTMALVDQLAEQGEATAVLIYDNGSSQETLDQLTAWQRPPGLGQLAVFDATGQNIHQMWNRGLEMAAASGQPCNVAILNNDLKIGPNFLSGLARALRSDPLAAVVSPNYDGRDSDPPGADCQVVRDICAGRYDGTGGIAGFAFMLKGEGGYRFPPELSWWYGDNDMMCAAAAAGMHGLIALDVTCEHIGGGSQTAGDWTAHAAVLELDREWFTAKWGAAFKPAAVESDCVCGGDGEGNCICADLNDRVMR